MGLTVAVLLLGALVWYAIGHHRAPLAEKLPATMEEFKQRPGGAATADAGDFLIGLAKEGKLPGFAPGEHGTMHAATVDWNGNIARATEAYPVSRMVHFSKNGDTSDYLYVVVCESQGAPWKLQRACRSDPDGHVVETYAVP